MKRLSDIIFPDSPKPPAPRIACRWCGNDNHAPDWCAAEILHKESTTREQRQNLERLVQLGCEAMVREARTGKPFILADYEEAHVLAKKLGRTL